MTEDFVVEIVLVNGVVLYVTFVVYTVSVAIDVFVVVVVPVADVFVVVIVSGQEREKYESILSWIVPPFSVKMFRMDDGFSCSS